MSVHQPQEIKEYLQRQDVQERIQQSIQQARSNVTVTISKAADLFGFTESRLREWEKKGLLESDRTVPAQDGKGHRRYTTNELDKLAILQELIEKGGYSLSQIPTDLDAIWKIIDLAMHTDSKPNLASKKPIDQRVKFAEQEVFWRYFTSQVLRLSLMLICEDIPEMLAGLILPFGVGARFISDPEDLSTLREVLVGWQDQNGSFDTFLDSAPFFKHPSDFRIEPLKSVSEENESHDLTMIVIQREARSLDLSLPLVQTVRHLLTQVYDNVSQWKAAFSEGKRDYLYQATDFNSTTTLSDIVLDKLMDMVIQIGGKSTQFPEKDRWLFCCLMLPEVNTLPLQKRSLIVRAQSPHSPYKVGITSVSVGTPGLSLRAYQSGNIIYRPDMSAKDAIIAYQAEEQSIRSAIAIPIIREDGLSIATLYIASEEAQAFPKEDQRLLRLLGIMIEELLLTYQARQQISGKRADLLDQPEIVDPSFKGVLTENDFIRDLEELLSNLQTTSKNGSAPEEAISFIAVDIDNHSILATRYGDLVARNLSKAVGTRLSGRFDLFADLTNKRLYHMNADRYYLLLDGMSLDETRKNAEKIRVALQGSYLIDAQSTPVERSKLPATLLELTNVTVRLGITSYKYDKVQNVLHRYDVKTAISEFRTLIMVSLERELVMGRDKGGNNIISWDDIVWDYILWTPPPSE